MSKKEVKAFDGVRVNSVAKKTGNKKKAKKSKSSSLLCKITGKTAMYIIGITIVIIVSKLAFDFGGQIFSAQGVDPLGEGKDVIITIPVDSDTNEVAEILKENNLIESEIVFKIQTFLYEAKIASGTYTLNTQMCGEDIIDAIRPVEKE